MKNIILATDFSLNAQIAAICAGEVARLIGARLIVFFALSPLILVKGKSPLSLESESFFQKKLDALAYEMNYRFGISVSRLLKPGFPEDEICALAERLNAAAVITGMKGESDKDGVEIGNVSRELLAKKNVPVLCIPAIDNLDFSKKLGYIDHNKSEFCNESGRMFLEELISKNALGELANKNS